MTYDLQIGAKDSVTTYRSYSRVNKLIQNTQFQAVQGRSKLVETPSQFKNSCFGSKPSSVTTACTYFTNDYSSIVKSDITKASTKKKTQAKKEQKPKQVKNLCGNKRSPEISTANLEYFSKLVSRNAKFVLKNFKLTNKKTGEILSFPIYDEKQLIGLRNSEVVRNFDMSQLEVEYDYETDSEQIVHSKKHLLDQLF